MAFGFGSRLAGAGAGAGALVALFAATPLLAQERTIEQRLVALQQQVEAMQRELARQDTAEVARMRRQIELLTREIEEMRLGTEVAAQADTTAYGFAPAASKVYRIQQGVSIGGYGEVHYDNFSEERENDTPSGARDQIDALRAILYFGYKFNDRLLFNSELEWEHGSTSGGTGEASIEFAYLDYILRPEFGLRGGMLLVPMGLTNELHEPPTYLGTTRPLVEQRIIPTTWRENGVGFFGEAGALSYRAYLINSFDGVGDGPSPAGGFSGSGLRGGRQKGARALAEDFAGVARVDYIGVPGLLVGGSGYLGETAQNRTLPGGQEVGGLARIGEVHADYNGHGVYARGLFAVATLDDAAELNQLRGLEGAGSIGERMTGGYAQLGYDVLRGVQTEHQIVPYVRYERLNTQSEVPSGFSANPANDRTAWVLGAMWKPITNISLKADYQIQRNEAETGISQFNINLAYLF